MDAVEVTKDDIRVFVKKEKNVDAAFKMLDSNEDGRVDMDDVVQSIEKVYFQRANLASTLRDNKSINYVLEFLIGAIIHPFRVPVPARPAAFSDRTVGGLQRAGCGFFVYFRGHRLGGVRKRGVYLRSSRLRRRGYAADR